MLLFTIIATSTAYAIDYGTYTGDNEDEINGKLNEFGSTIESIYNIGAKVGYPLAALVVAIGVLSILFATSQRGKEKGLTMIKYAIIALFLMTILPVVIEVAIGFVQDNAWTPPSATAPMPTPISAPTPP